MNKKLLKGKIMNIKRIIVLVLISASSGLLCAQRKTVNMSDRYGILTELRLTNIPEQPRRNNPTGQRPD